MVSINKFGLLAALLIISLFACREKNKTLTLFELMPPDKTGIDFSNKIVEDENLNILSFEYFYNGAGVGIGDFNNDGLKDIFFSSNMGESKLYQNKGNFEFKDITDSSGINTTGKWAAGVSIVDINQDGLQDIYVCFGGPNSADKRANALYINNGNNSFTDKARAYGLADSGHSVQAVFFDYDKDNDLDMYLLTNITDEMGPNVIRPKRNNGEMVNTDRLYNNNGNGTFSNVSRQAGILKEGYGLGVSVCDINQDGWPDIYVSNDYVSNDLLYINNKDGSFTDQASTVFKHTSYSAMGNDVSDFNNDGLLDLIEVDMLPGDNYRKKMMLGSTNHDRYRSEIQYGYDPQYMRNTLQLNQGLDNNQLPNFSEISMLAGVSATDWSWCPLFADLDNDGWNDLIITNGYPRDITNRDFITYRAQDLMQQQGIGSKTFDALQKLDGAYLHNFIFKNKKDLRFQDVSTDWGFTQNSYSTGAAYADLDNDGDLDMVVTNTGVPAFVYKNNADSIYHNHFLNIALQGPEGNKSAYGTKINLYANGLSLYQEHQTIHGYQSSMQDEIHFGLGQAKQVDSLVITWPDGKSQHLLAIKSNQLLTIKYTESVIEPLKKAATKKTDWTFMEYNLGDEFIHKETPYTDFNIQPLLPHKFSMAGPGIAVGDINADGLDDFFVGGAYKQSGKLFYQQKNGKFTTRLLDIDKKYEEDMGVLFFDADNDHDLDLYVVSGGNEFADGAKYYQDRLYFNDGKGNFTLKRDALPINFSSGSCVVASDFDRDGDLDLFVGGKIRPQHYPEGGKSQILENVGGRFIDITTKIAPGLNHIGMVNAAVWSDINNDNLPDLLVVGEWMPITVFLNNGKTFQNITTNLGLSNSVGWWNSIQASDINHDGRIDYVVGNQGINSRYTTSLQNPLSIYVNDFSNDGNNNAVITYTQNGKVYPIHPRDDLMQQLPGLRKKFPLYHDYANATIQDLFPAEKIEEATSFSANTMQTSVLINQVDSKWKLNALPIDAQFAPVFGTLINDYDGDGLEDIILIGNDFSAEEINGQYDAFNGLVLKGDGKGGFYKKDNTFKVKGDGKGLAEMIVQKNTSLIIAAQNNDQLLSFLNSKKQTGKIIRAGANDAYAIIQYADGKKLKKEVYYGSGYLSSSSRFISIPEAVKSVQLVTYQGKQRTVLF
jgi:hypothetical protein